MAGRLKPGEALPSELQLAEMLGIARSTVRQALAALERDGLVRRVHGKGTFVHEQARQRLRRGQDLFALLLPESQGGFYPALQRHFEEAATGLHNQVILCNTNNDIDKQGNAVLQLIDMRVAGVAVVPTTAPPTPAYQMRQLQQHGIPVVFCMRRVEGVAAPLLTIPFEHVGQLAGQALLERGHRRAAFFSTYRYWTSLAYENGLRRAGVDLPEPLVYHGSSPSPEIAAHQPEILRMLESVCRRPDRPTAIFASFDSLAEELYLLLGRLGLRVPENMSLIGFCGSRRDGAMMKRLTSVTVDEAQMGRQAAALLDQMRRGELPLEHEETHLIPLGLSEGESLGRISLSA
jgi:DNA-binding LacI/PurR family transcriptional regulator